MFLPPAREAHPDGHREQPRKEVGNQQRPRQFRRTQGVGDKQDEKRHRQSIRQAIHKIGRNQAAEVPVLRNDAPAAARSCVKPVMIIATRGKAVRHLAKAQPDRDGQQYANCPRDG